MRIDLKKLSQLEKEYGNYNGITLNALQEMVSIVLRQSDSVAMATTTSSYMTAYQTLKDLGVLTNDPSESKPLNS